MTLAARAREVFLELQEIAVDRRAEFLTSRCADDPEVREQVESLLEALEAARPQLLVGALESAESYEDEPEAPRVIGPFTLRERIGVGGMGMVYRAEQRFPQRVVALKLVRHTGVDGTWFQRFRNEVEILGRLQHPGIAQVYEAGIAAGELGDVPWFAMELVDGKPIHCFATEHGLDFQRRCALLAAVCDAVQHAHDRGIVHRDLKPANILVCKGEHGLGRPKVLDFGIARMIDGDSGASCLTRTGYPIGTLPYMSPEQITGKLAVDARSDVYSLGVVLHELLTGKVPFNPDESGFQTFVHRVAEVEPKRISKSDRRLKGDLETIVATALAKDPQLRYLSAADLAEDLRRWSEHLPIRARRANSWYQLQRFAKRNRGLVAAVVVVLVILMAGVIATTVASVRASRNEHAARRTAYSATITEISSSFRTDPLAAEEQLARTDPEERGFEWFYLTSQLDRGRRFPVPPLDEQSDWHTQCAVGWAAEEGPRYARVAGNGIEVHDLANGLVIHRLRTDGRPLRPRFDAAVRHVAALESQAEHGVNLRVWDMADGSLQTECAIPNASPGPWSIRADCAVAAIVTGERYLVIVDLRTGETRRSVRLPAAEHAGPRTHAEPVFVDGGASVETASIVFDVATAREVRRTNSVEGRWHSLDSDGQVTARAEWWQRSMVIEDAKTGVELRQFSGLRGFADTVVLSPCRRRVAAVDNSGIVVVWDRDLGVLLGAYPSRARWLAFDRQGSRLLAATPDGPVEWQLDEGGSRELRGHPSYAYLVAYSRDGSLIVSSDSGGHSILWDAITGEKLAEHWNRGGSRITFSADDDKIVAWDRPHMAWDVITGDYSECESVIAPSRPADRIGNVGAWDNQSADGQVHVSAVDSGVRLRDSSGREIASIPLADVGLDAPRRVARVRSNLADLHQILAPSVGLDAGGERIAVGHRDGTLDLLDVSSGACIARVRRHFGPIYDVAFSPDRRRIATAGNDGVIRLWHAESLEPVGVLRGHKSYVKSVAFRPDGKQLASVSGDGSLRLWDALPEVERLAMEAAHRELLGRMRPRVRATLDSKGAASLAAEVLARDRTLSPSERRAARIALIALAAERRAR